jgi:predicted SAM-dependent methyltransferase
LRQLPTSGLQLNLGCGPKALPGWVNVDINRGPHVDVVWDLSRPLPFRTASCAAIFGEHVIEHLTRSDAENLLRECHRVLETGGVLRLSTPDAGRYLRSYAGDGEFLHHPQFPQQIGSRLDRINMMMREEGQHLWVYDAESLTTALRQVGFASVTVLEFNVSHHPAMREIDSADRAFESLYVEATK